jgi:hypothetical protein
VCPSLLDALHHDVQRGNAPPNVVINELTTIASGFTAARFINKGAISGNTLGFRVAAENACAKWHTSDDLPTQKFPSGSGDT